jgi:histidyl-tRNA synthetase
MYTKNNKFISIPLKGFRDWYKEEVFNLSFIEKTFMDITSLYHCTKIITPVIERCSLFEKSAGETSEIVSHQMFIIEGNSHEKKCLVPEGTASSVRFAINNNIKEDRLCYFNKFFRGERPQKGRYREFFQGAVEFIGESGIISILEMLSLAMDFLKKIGIHKKIIFKINHLCSNVTRYNYLCAFKEYLLSFQDSLSLLSQKRLEKNPLRIWDSKEINDINILKYAPTISSFWKDKTIENMKIIKKHIEKAEIKVVVDTSLVRGLDYYTGFVFEVDSLEDNIKGLSILGGGEYNNLFFDISGEDIKGLGFAFGADRILLTDFIMEKIKKKIIIIIPVENEDIEYSTEATGILRSKNIIVKSMYDFSKSVTKRIEKSLKMFADYNIYLCIIGSTERNNLSQFLVKKAENKESFYINLYDDVLTLI